MGSRNAKRVDPIDAKIGERVRLRRVMLGLTQQKLGQELGVTFQQVQKYEGGYNRISPNRMNIISRVLHVPVGYFFDDTSEQDCRPETAEDSEDLIRFASSREGRELNMAFPKIKDKTIRDKVLELMRTLAQNPTDAGGLETGT